MGTTNFTECQIIWQPRLAANATLRSMYGWRGPVMNIPKNESTQISFHACQQLCGTGTDYYPWSQASDTITTWVLPITGVIVQAPFVSNAFWDTVFTLARWIGSPMASLAAILWNIRVSGKAALMTDMSTRYEEKTENSKSPFCSIRDAFTILMTMNQYAMSRTVLSKRETSGLLRIVLFSKDLRLLKPDVDPHKPSFDGSSNPAFWDHTSSSDPPNDSALRLLLDERCEPIGALDTARQKLALQLRQNRRRGVVPVFISTVWFLFSMAISIQDSFGDLGVNATAHDLALGCLLSWLPVLILCGIVDRNPVSSDDVRDKLNKLIRRVRLALEDPLVRQDYIRGIHDTKLQEETRRWVERICQACPQEDDSFFQDFAGQGRVRWHYGVAHSILTDIETGFIKAAGRGWLYFEEKARYRLVLGKIDEGLDWFDFRELWQVFAAVIIVIGCAAGAWMISFFTPTVGLGCRSGGYTVFLAAALGLLIVEMVIWWSLDADKKRLKGLVQHRRSSLPPTMKEAEKLAVRQHNLEKNLSRWLFRPLEIMNTVFLFWLVLAQTIGADQTCECMTSTWGAGGGYMDFTQWNVANSQYVDQWWIIGTCTSTLVMGLSMIYIVLEWCLQSHLSTADLKDAAAGLQNTRRFRYAMDALFLGRAASWTTSGLHWSARVHRTETIPMHSVATRETSTPVARRTPVLHLNTTGLPPRARTPSLSPQTPSETPTRRYRTEGSRASHEALLSPPSPIRVSRRRSMSPPSPLSIRVQSPSGSVLEDEQINSADGGESTRSYA